jgi:hypothetical protein
MMYFDPLKEFWAWTTHDAVAFYTSVLALFTGVLGVSTVGLWIATNRTLKHAQETAQRQLRAYLTVESGGVVLLNNATQINASIIFKNTGQTPAYGVMTWASVGIKSMNAANPFASAPAIAARSGHAKSIAGPGQNVNIGTTTYITAADLAAVTASQSAIFFWGRVDYVDSFENPRFSVFKERISGPPTPAIAGTPHQGWELRPDPSGYEAN